MSNALGAGAPGGGDQGGFLQWLQGLAPQAQSAIMRVMQNANPVQPAAADTLQQAPNPLNNPSPVNPALANGGPPVPPVLTQTPNAAAAIGNPHGDGPPPPPPAVVGAPPVAAYNGAPPIGGGPGMAMEAPTGPQSTPIGGGPGMAMEAPTGTPVARVRAAPVHVRARIPATARAQVPPAAAGGALPGYYAPTTGNARGSTWSPYMDPNDPRIFRGGPLAR